MFRTTLDKVTIRLPYAKKTMSAGISLASSIYKTPLTIALSGELGAGKTTFLQGFAKGLGISDHLTSPTYALEQRYQTERFGELLHIDLYRIEAPDAISIIESSDDHEGIRCIEWADRIEGFEADIEIRIIEDPDDRNTRTLECIFKDINIPSQSEVDEWRKEVHLPTGVIGHCDAVADASEKIGKELLDMGKLLRPIALRRSAEIHDLFKFIDFSKSSPPKIDEPQIWKELIIKYEGHSHESACAAFLEGKGYSEIASIVGMHGFSTENHPNMTTEQKVLFYTDKRTTGNELGSIDDRFEYLKKTYADGKETDFHRKWKKETKSLEDDLFDGPAPF